MVKKRSGKMRIPDLLLVAGILTASLFGCSTRSIVTDVTAAKIETTPLFNAYLSSDGTLWVQQMGGTVSNMTLETTANLGDGVQSAYESGVYDGKYYGVKRLCDDVMKITNAIQGIYILKTNDELYLHPHLSGKDVGEESVLTLIAKGVKNVTSQNGEVFYILENGDVISPLSQAPEKSEIFVDETGRENHIIAKGCKDVGTLFYVTEQGELFIKGANSYGVFGNGTFDETPYSDYVFGLVKEPTGYDIRKYTKAFDGVNKAYGLIANIYAIREDNTLWAWGDNEFGLVGNGEQGDGCEETRDVVTTPVKVLDNVQKLVSVDTGFALDAKNRMTAGPDAVFALTYDGDVYAWGNNTYGMAGDGYKASEGEELIVNAPKKILSGVADIVSNQFAIFALKNDGTVLGWGLSTGGQTGTGKQNVNGRYTDLNAEDFVAKPTKILSNVVYISQASGATMAAIQKDGSLVMWGDNPFKLILPDEMAVSREDKRAVAIQGIPAVNPFIKCKISAEGEIIFEST